MSPVHVHKAMSKQNRFSLLDSAESNRASSMKNHTLPKLNPPKRKYGGQLKKLPTGFKRKSRKKRSSLPVPVVEQRRLRSKFRYCYRDVHNGNIENNTTLYVSTGVAHHHQVEAIFDNVIKKAKSMPEVFGEDFECDVQVNLVRKHSGQYMGYAFIDVSNPAVYYALIGCETDGRDRVEFVPDPTWTPPSPSEIKPVATTLSWADMDDDDWFDDSDFETPSAPRIRKELPPLLTLDEFDYDDQQQSYLKTKETKGNLSISPAFITPGVNDDYDDCKLFVTEVPSDDHDFLYAIFARYARNISYREDDHYFYPKITIRKNSNGEKYYAIVQYAHSYDTAFALLMLQKVRAKYNGEDVFMRVRYAFDKNHQR